MFLGPCENFSGYHYPTLARRICHEKWHDSNLFNLSFWHSITSIVIIWLVKILPKPETIWFFSEENGNFSKTFSPPPNLEIYRKLPIQIWIKVIFLTILYVLGKKFGVKNCCIRVKGVCGNRFFMPKLAIPKITYSIF